MAAILWKPVTIGEVVFQRLHRDLSQRIEVSHEATDLDFLVSPDRFREFTRLTATLEVFLRTLRSAARTYVELPEASGQTYGQRVRGEADVPASIATDPAFGEDLRRLGPVAHGRRRNTKVERNVLRSGGTQCYLCGITLVATGNEHNAAAVDHIWPLRLAGEGIEENLAVACKDCNSKKGHAATWAWGPVQSTYEEIADAAVGLNRDLRMSLVLARIMFAASAPGNRSTLKEAAERIWPAAAHVSMPPGKPHVYFECLRSAEELE